MTSDALPPVEIISSATCHASGPEGGLAASLLECSLALRSARDDLYAADEESVGRATEAAIAADGRAILSSVAVMPRFTARMLLAELVRLVGAGRLVPGR